MSEESPSFRMVGDMGELFAAKAKARAQFQPIVKSCKVDVYKKDTDRLLYSFWYADLDAILSATQAGLTANGLDLSWYLHDAPEGGRALRCILSHSSGAFIESILTIPPQDGPQELASAVTYARRYQAGCVLGVAAERDDDGNAASGQDARPPEPAKRREPPAPEPKPEPVRAAARPASAPPPANDAPPMGQDLGLKIKHAFEALRYSTPQATAKILEVCGVPREQLRKPHGEKLLAALETELKRAS